MAGRQGDGLRIQPTHQPCPCFGGQPLAADVQGFPEPCVQPAGSGDQMHHGNAAGGDHELLLQHRHILDHVAQRQAIASQSGWMEHLVEGGHCFTSLVFIWRLHQQPLKLGTVEESSRQAQNVVWARLLDVAGFGLPGLRTKNRGRPWWEVCRSGRKSCQCQPIWPRITGRSRRRAAGEFVNLSSPTTRPSRSRLGSYYRLLNLALTALLSGFHHAQRLLYAAVLIIRFESARDTKSAQPGGGVEGCHSAFTRWLMLWRWLCFTDRNPTRCLPKG